MSMRRLTMVAVAGFAIAEIALLAWITHSIGFGMTLLLLLASGAVGGLIWRFEGGKAWASLRDAQAHPQEATGRLPDAALVLTGGLLFLLPGVLSDVLALVFVVPVTRPLVRRALKALLANVTRPYRDQVNLMQAQMDPDSVVEGEMVVDPQRPGRGRHDDPQVIRGEIA